VVTNWNAICGHASRHPDIGATLTLIEVIPREFRSAAIRERC